MGGVGNGVMEEEQGEDLNSSMAAILLHLAMQLGKEKGAWP